jgi:hypothetical protein
MRINFWMKKRGVSLKFTFWITSYLFLLTFLLTLLLTFI